MAGVKLKLQSRHAHLFDTHAKGAPRQRIAHLYQTIRMRPAIFGKHIKDMDNVKPACAVIFRGDIGETVESLVGKLSPTELQTLGYTIDAIDYARRAEIAIYKRDPPSFSLLAEHPEGGLIVGKYVTQDEKDQIMWRLWYILAMLMVDDDTLADEEQTPWDEICLSVTLYCWVKHLMGVTACISESTCRCAKIARTYGIPASAFRAAWVYVDKRCHRWLPSDRYRTIPVSTLAPEVRMVDIFIDTDPPGKLPMMASVIHLPIPPYHSIRLKPSSSRSLSPVKHSISAQHNKKPSSVMSCDPLEDVEVPVHPPFHTNYKEVTAGKTSKSSGPCYNLVTKLVSKSILQRRGINSRWKSIVLREEDWIVVGWALVYRRLLGLCIQDICGAIPSPVEGFKPWHIGRLVDMLMYLQFRRQRVAVTHKNIHGYYPSFRALVLSAKHNSSTHSPSRTTEGESLRCWTLLRAVWELLGRLFVWEDANVTSVGGGSGLLNTTQIHDSVHPTLVIDWKSTAFPLAITSWVKHSLPYSTCYLSINDAICKCKNACKLYHVSYDEFLAAYSIVDSICKREGWTIDSMTYTKTGSSKVIGSLGVADASKAGKTSPAPALAPQTLSIATENVVNHLSPVREFESTQNRGSLSGGNEYKSNESVLDGSPKRKTSSDRTLSRAAAPMPSDAPSLLQTHDKPKVLPSPSPKKSRKLVPSPRMQDKSTPIDLTCRRRMVSLKTPSGVESSAKLEKGCDNSVDSGSGSGSGSDQSFKPEWVFHDIDASGTSGSRPREAEPYADVRPRRSTRISPSHKLIDWSSESDGGATPDELWKGNRRVRVPPSTPGPSDGEGKRPRGRPRKYAGPPRMSKRGVGMAAARPRGRPRRKRVTMSTSSNPHLDSQMGQSRCPSDAVGPNATVPRHLEVEVSMGHQPLESANRRFQLSPGECERREGRAAYVSKAPIDTEGMPKPVIGQEGTHDEKSGSDPDPLDCSREINHRVTHAVGRKLAVRTGPLEMKKRKYLPDRLAPEPGEIEVPEENQPNAKRFKREHPVVGSSGHHQIRQSTTISSSVSSVSLLIYDLNADRRKTSLAEERRRLLNMCRLFGIPIAMDVETVPENGGIGICEPLSVEVLEQLNYKKITHLRDNFGLVLSFKPPTPLLNYPILPTPPSSSCALNPAKSITSSLVSEVDVHSESEEQDTLSFYDDQSELRISLVEEANRLVGLIQEVCRTNLQEMDWNIEMVHGHVAVVLQDKDAIRRACSMLAPTFVREEMSRRNVTVLRGEERWVIPPAASQWLVPKKLHHPPNVKTSARYQRNLALFNKTVAARSWTSAAVQGFHW